MARLVGGPFLISAAPGRGQDAPGAGARARELLEAGRIVARRRRLPDDAADAPVGGGRRRALGVQLAPDAGELRPPRDFDGVAVDLRARRRSPASAGRAQCAPGTLVIADEAHHLGEELAWGEGFAPAFGARRRAGCCCRGTPFRSDQCPIPGVRYDGRRRDARRLLQLRRRRPRRHLPAGRRSSPTTARCVAQRRRRHRVLVRRRAGGARGRPPLPHRDLDRARRRPAADPARGPRAPGGGARAAGTATPAGSSSPPTASTRGAVAKVLREVTGSSPVVVAAHRRRAPRASCGVRAIARERWIVAVNMVAEGVDIPRLRVGVYATAAKTPLIFRQIVGRFVRTLAGPPRELSWLYLPADPVLRAHAAEVERELRHVLRPPRRRRRARRAARPRRATRAGRGAGRSSRRRRRRAAARAVRRRRPPRRPPVVAPRSPRPSPSPTDRSRPPSSAARCCATSATASSPSCARRDGRRHARSTAG